MPILAAIDPLDEVDEEVEWRARDERSPVFVRLGGFNAPLGYLRIVDNVPETRAECPPRVDRQHRLCGHCRCSYNLLMVEGEDRPGRRVDGKSPESTLVPMWWSNPVPSMCALDLADAQAETGEPMPIEDVGKHNRLQPSRVHEILATCERKLRAHGRTLEDLMMGER